MKKTILKKSDNFLGSLFFNKKDNKANLALVVLNYEENNPKIEIIGSCGYCLFYFFEDKLSAEIKFKEIKNLFKLNKEFFLEFKEESPIEKFL